MTALRRVANPHAGMVLLLMLVALAVRVPHLQWGLPDVEEEALPAKKAFEMWGWAQGDLQLDPGTAGWPSLSFYVFLAVQAVQRVVGAWSGRYPDALDFYVEYQIDPTAVIAWARGFSVLLSLVLVGVAFRMGSRLGGLFAASVAGALVALSPMLVRHAQMVEPDLLLSVFAALAMLRALDVLERGRLSDYVAVAAFAGLGAASKYTPALLTISLYVVHLMRLRREGRGLRGLGLDDRRIGWAAVASLLAFCLASPYTFADLDVLRRDIAYQLMHMSEGHFGHAEQGVGYVHYLSTVLPRALGWPAFLASLPGLVLASRRRDGAPALVWCVAPYFVVLGSLSTHFDRYMMPLVVPLAVSAAITVDALRGLIRERRRATLLATALAAILLGVAPAWTVARYHRVQSAPSTQRQAADWIESHLPRETTTLILERYGPHLLPDQRETTRNDPVFARLSDTQKERLLDRPYFVFQTLPMYSTRVHLAGYYYDLRHFLAYDVIVVSGSVRNRYLEDPDRYPRQAQFYADLERYTEIAARFAPDGRARGPEIILHQWTAGGRRSLLEDRGPLAPDHFRAFVEQVHAPDFLGFVESVAVHAEFEEAWGVASDYYTILTQTAYPDDRRWFVERAGITAISAGLLDRAEEMFDELLARDPHSVIALGNLGLVAERRGDADTARIWYLRCIEADEEGSARRWAERRLADLDGAGDQRR